MHRLRHLMDNGEMERYVIAKQIMLMISVELWSKANAM